MVYFNFLNLEHDKSTDFLDPFCKSNKMMKITFDFKLASEIYPKLYLYQVAVFIIFCYYFCYNFVDEI